MKARGFTLIELALVVLIAAIAAAAVTLRLEGPLRGAQMRDVTEAIVAFDRLTRTHAREHDRPVHLTVDLVRGRLRRTDADGRRELGAPMTLPPDYRIARLWIRGRTVAETRATIPCGRLGLTPTYALALDGPGRRRQTLVFAGLSGELFRVDDERELEAIFQAASARRHSR